MKIKHQLRRSDQQWILDWMIKQTGRPINFEHDNRYLPGTVKNMAMIARECAKVGRYHARFAAAAKAAGHPRTAIPLYERAVWNYHSAQHQIFVDDHELKQFYYERLVESYDAMVECASYPIERIEVPWEGAQIQCLLHLLPDRRKAPCVLLIPGLDMVKEQLPSVAQQDFLQRGMHVISMDGPGQGVSNLRKVRLTHDNYERAASAVVDYLESRPEVDSKRIGVLGISLGTFWAARLAALDSRVYATAAAMSSYGDGDHLFNRCSPRFKQVLMYVTGSEREEQLDELIPRMATAGLAEKIRSAFLVFSGDADPACPLEDVEEFYDALAGPREMWVLENEGHELRGERTLAGVPWLVFAADWLEGALVRGRIASDHDRKVFVRAGGNGPFSEPTRERISSIPY
jgi:dipeptidyl aminopeptidase/acylaminoacyl peptidase